MSIATGAVWEHAKERAFVPPSINLDKVGNENVCCNKGPVFVVKNTSSDSSKKYAFDQRRFTLFDCRGASFGKKAQEGKEAVFADLVSKYGYFETAAAFRLAGVREIRTLTIDELFIVSQYLEETKRQHKNVERLMRQTAHWAQYNTVDPHHNAAKSNDFNEDDYIVVKDRDGRTENFSLKKLEAELQQTEFESAVSNETIREVAKTVGQAIAAINPQRKDRAPKTEVDATSIRTITCQELKRRNLPIKMPEAFNSQPGAVQIAMSCIQRTGDISEELYTHFVKAQIGNFTPKERPTESTRLK